MNIVAITGRLMWDVKLTKVNFIGTKDSHVLNNCLSFRTTSRKEKEKYGSIPITAWGAKAELLARYAKKGDKISISGEMRNNLRKIGDDEYIFSYVLVDRIELVESKSKNGPAQQQNNAIESDIDLDDFFSE